MKRKQIYLATIDPNAHWLARDHGFGLELSEFCTAWNMDEQFGKVAPMLAEKCSCARRFTLHAPFNELFPCAIDPKARELARSRYLQSFDLAKRYSAEKVVIHGGYNPWLYFPVWYKEQSIAFWKDFVHQIPDGITVCLENVLEERPEMLLEIVEGVHDPRLRLCLDVGHGNAYSKVDVMEWLRMWAPYLAHFHIHNNDTTWDTHSALDEGTIPMEDFLNQADALCPLATFTLELPEAERSCAWLETHFDLR